MSTKKKRPSPKPGRLIPTTKEPDLDKAKQEYDLAYAVKVGHEIVKLLEKLIERLEPPQQRMTLGEYEATLRPRFVSGGFKRRSGDIYQTVAEPGTPNAGEADGDDPSGHL